MIDNKKYPFIVEVRLSESQLKLLSEMFNGDPEYYDPYRKHYLALAEGQILTTGTGDGMGLADDIKRYSSFEKKEFIESSLGK